MKLIRADQDQFEFEIGPGEKIRMQQVLKLYPLVPTSHHKLSAGRKIPNREESEQLLAESLKAQREENHRQVESLLNDPRRFVKFEKGCRATFTRDEIEWLLQVFNDVRVGSWIALGSPEPDEETHQRLNKQNAPHIMALDVAGHFESILLDAVSGDLRPGEELFETAVLGEDIWFPNPEAANAAGLVAVGGDLKSERLLAAYRRGIFPWTANPVTWWSPDPRGILELNHFHVSESLAKVIRSKTFEVTTDRAFQDVMQACAAPGPKRRSTWITAEFIAAYTQLHKQGHAHSVECWQNRELVGGIYGVAIGGLFAGESMFHRANNASKVALYHLVGRLRERRFLLFDIQMVTAATEPLGARAISRSEYLKRLAVAVAQDCSF
jgi:leucyl/phenylalanyl-tRNA--protein transferase